MVNSKDFAKRLEKVFSYYELNASSFAEKIDVGRASISHLLSGRNKPSLEFVLKVVKAFPEVELYWLLNGKGSFPAKNETNQKQSHAPNQEVFKDTNKTVDSNSVTNSTSFMPATPMHTHNKSDSAIREIERIVIFYKDGTFEAFNPTNHA